MLFIFGNAVRSCTLPPHSRRTEANLRYCWWTGTQRRTKSRICESIYYCYLFRVAWMFILFSFPHILFKRCNVDQCFYTWIERFVPIWIFTKIILINLIPNILGMLMWEEYLQLSFHFYRPSSKEMLQMHIYLSIHLPTLMFRCCQVLNCIR